MSTYFDRRREKDKKLRKLWIPVGLFFIFFFFKFGLRLVRGYNSPHALDQIEHKRKVESRAEAEIRQLIKIHSVMVLAMNKRSFVKRYPLDRATATVVYQTEQNGRGNRIIYYFDENGEECQLTSPFEMTFKSAEEVKRKSWLSGNITVEGQVTTSCTPSMIAVRQLADQLPRSFQITPHLTGHYSNDEVEIEGFETLSYGYSPGQAKNAEIAAAAYIADQKVHRKIRNDKEAALSNDIQVLDLAYELAKIEINSFSNGFTLTTKKGVLFLGKFIYENETAILTSDLLADQKPEGQAVLRINRIYYQSADGSINNGSLLFYPPGTTNKEFQLYPESSVE